MQAIISVENLQQVIDLASRFVSKQTTLPILQHIYIKFDVDTVLFRATDMEKYIDIEVPANISSPGTITVDAKVFSEYIKTIEDKEVEVIWDEKKNMLTIKSSSDNMKIKWSAWSEYVWVPEISGNKNTISAIWLLKWFNKVDFAIVEKNFPVLQWVLVRTKDYNGTKKMVFTGSDSLRLADYKINYDWDLDNLNVIIPKTNISEIKKTLEYFISIWGDDCQICLSSNLIAFYMKKDEVDIKIVSLLISGQYPEYENEAIMPKVFQTTVLIDKNILEKAIRKINILTRDTNNFIKFDIQDSKIVCDSTEMDLWQAETTISAEINGEVDATTIAINGKFILDVIRILDSNQIQLNLNGNDKPVVIKDVDDSSFGYVCKTINF